MKCDKLAMPIFGAAKSNKLSRETVQGEMLGKFWSLARIHLKPANKLFWQTIRRLRGKRSHTTTFINDTESNILRGENCIYSKIEKKI